MPKLPPILRTIPKGIVTEIPSGMKFAPGLSARQNARRLEEFFSWSAPRQSEFNGADGMYTHGITDLAPSLLEPGALPDRTLFAMGDTYVGGRIGPFRLPPNRLNFIRNSQAVVEGDEFRLILRDYDDRLLRNHREWLVPEQSQAKFSSTHDREWYWPADVTQTDAGVQMLLGHYGHTGPDVYWDWGVQGTHVATLEPETLNLIDIHRAVPDDTTIWGAALLEHPKSGHLYIYGAADGPAGEIPQLKIARSPIADARMAWEFLTDKGTWSERASDAGTLPIPVASQFSVLDNPRGGVDLLVQHGFWPDLKVIPGDTPIGPFHMDRTQTYQIPEVPQPRYVVNAIAHPEYSDAERVVISVNQNRFDGVGLNPADYRPHFMTIPRPGTTSRAHDQALEFGR